VGKRSFFEERNTKALEQEQQKQREADTIHAMESSTAAASYPTDTHEQIQYNILSNADKVDIMLSVFRGFAFYNLHGSEDYSSFSSASHFSSNIDLLHIPVQPNEADLMDWKTDFLWDTIQQGSFNDYKSAGNSTQMPIRR
jgi:hypothetical protein